MYSFEGFEDIWVWGFRDEVWVSCEFEGCVDGF